MTVPQIAVPSTPAGARLAEWLTAFNTGDAAILRSFLEAGLAPSLLKTRSAAERAGARMRTYAQSQGFVLERALASEPCHVEALLRERVVEDWWQIRITVEDQAPHLITGFTLARAPEPAERRETSVPPPEQVAERVDGYVSRLAGADVFSGAVLVALNGDILMAKAWGLASRAWSVPNTVDTRFNLGSCNKLFTSVAVLRQVARGRITLQDKVGDILPDYPNADVAANVTVHHLLTHTSGLGSFFNQQFAGASRARFREVADYAPLYVNEPLTFRPGERFSYSNTGMMLLGVILEKVTGEDYFHHIRDNIYRPAGMTHTDSYDLDADEPDIAVGYTSTGPDGAYRPGPRRSNIFTHIAKGSPAGGGFSTVEDMLRFGQALRDNVLLKPETTALMLTPHAATDFDPAVKIGYGIFLETLAGRRIAGHSGVFAGVNTQVDMHLDTGYTVIVLSNYDPPAARRVAHKSREWIR